MKFLDPYFFLLSYFVKLFMIIPWLYLILEFKCNRFIFPLVQLSIQFLLRWSPRVSLSALDDFFGTSSLRAVSVVFLVDLLLHFLVSCRPASVVYFVS